MILFNQAYLFIYLFIYCVFVVSLFFVFRVYGIDYLEIYYKET